MGRTCCLPLATRSPGVWRWQMETGARWREQFPWVFMRRPKIVTLHGAGEALPTVVPVTATTCPTVNISTFSSGRRQRIACPCQTNSASVAGGDRSLGEMAGGGPWALARGQGGRRE